MGLQQDEKDSVPNPPQRGEETMREEEPRRSGGNIKAGEEERGGKN